MKTNIIYTCEKCGMEFENEKECFDHEQSCGIKKKFTCYKCGKTIEWDSNDMWAFAISEGCHTINLGRLGYGSALDGCDVEFNLCDDCLEEFIQSFTWVGKAKVYNSGSNEYGSDEEWIQSQLHSNDEVKNILHIIK